MKWYKARLLKNNLAGQMCTKFHPKKRRHYLIELFLPDVFNLYSRPLRQG